MESKHEDMGAFLERTLTKTGNSLISRKVNAILLAEGGGYGSYKLAGERTDNLQNVMLRAALDNPEVAAMVSFTYAQLLAMHPEIEALTRKVVDQCRRKADG